MFTVSDKSKWIKEVQKYIKDQSVEALNHEVSDGIKYSPFSVDQNSYGQLITGSHMSGVVFSGGISNHALKTALQNGAQAIYIDIDISLSFEEIAELLDGIHLDYIFPVFKISNKLTVAELSRYLNEKYQDPQIPALVSSESINYPTGYALIPSNNDDPINDICHQLNHIREAANQKYAIEVMIGKQFFFEIAKLRAIRIVAANLWDTDEYPLTIIGKVDSKQINMNDHQGLIAQTAASMSCVLGGANVTVIKPWESDNELSRLSLNIQNIQSLESHITEIEDPLYGSYFIEDLTKKVANKIWEGL